MKKFVHNGKIYDRLPDPLITENGSVSPVTEALFAAMGGTVTDDGEPTPQERIRSAFSALVSELAGQTDAITPAEFLAAARNGISGDLIAFARSRGVPESVIAEGRARIVEVMADALRFGMSWADLIAGGSGA